MEWTKKQINEKMYTTLILLQKLLKKTISKIKLWHKEGFQMLILKEIPCYYVMIARKRHIMHSWPLPTTIVGIVICLSVCCWKKLIKVNKNLLNNWNNWIKPTKLETWNLLLCILTRVWEEWKIQFGTHENKEINEMNWINKKNWI